MAAGSFSVVSNPSASAAAPREPRPRSPGRQAESSLASLTVPNESSAEPELHMLPELPGHFVGPAAPELELERLDLVIEPSVRRWETPDRFYEAHITADMFDSLVMFCINGGLKTRRGQLRTVAVGPDQIRAAMTDLLKRRLSRAYLLVSYSRTS